MTPLQQNNCIEWVTAMLYEQCGHYSPLQLRPATFEIGYGLPHGPDHYDTLRKYSSGYLAVCALILEECNTHPEYQTLHNKMMEQFRATRVKESS